jgi:hypothetical protein
MEASALYEHKAIVEYGTCIKHLFICMEIMGTAWFVHVGGNSFVFQSAYVL